MMTDEQLIGVGSGEGQNQKRGEAWGEQMGDAQMKESGVAVRRGGKGGMTWSV